MVLCRGEMMSANKKIKLVPILLVLLFLIFLVPTCIVLMNRPTIPVVAVPEVNGFDSIRAVSDRIVSEDLFTDEVDSMKEFVEANREVVEELDAVVNQNSIVPIDYQAGFMGVADQAHALRPAMRLQMSIAEIAKADGDYPQAAVEFAKLYALANKIDVDGALVHFQIASAYRRAALSGLKEIAGSLTQEQKDEVVSILAGNGIAPVDLPAIVAREDTIAKLEHGTLQVLITKLVTPRNRSPAIAEAKAVDTEMRLREAEVNVLLK